MSETAVLNGGAFGVIGSDTRRVEKYGNEGDGVWKEKKGKWGILSHVRQSEEGIKGAEQVSTLLIDFKNFWKETFKPDETKVFQPDKELVRKIFEKSQKLENDLNTLFIQNPEALKAWHPSDHLNQSDLQHKASETQVLEKEKADTIWQRALEQMDGQKSRSEYNIGNSKEGGSWVLDALDRLDDIVTTERATITPFVTIGGPYKDNYNKFVNYIKSNEVNWTKVSTAS
jgi:hypothetical protein